MDALKNLLSLRQTRQFTDRPISDEVLNGVLEAARWTGSSRNSQPWQLVVVRDRATLRSLGTIVPYGGFIADAAAAVAIVIQGEGRGYGFDAGRITEHLMLAAHALGVGSGVATMADEGHERQALELLAVPGGHSLRAVVALGYPRPLTADERAARAARPGRGRKPLADLVHHERFGQRA